MHHQWMASPYALTLHDLYAQDPTCPFMHNNIIYTGVLRLEPAPEDPDWLTHLKSCILHAASWNTKAKRVWQSC